MAQHFEEKATIELLEINQLPVFNKPENYTVLPEVQELVDKIEAADGVVIATPEYDHSPTAALNNALAWLSYGVYPFVDKPVMVVGASYGTLGSSRAQLQLLQILEAPELQARTMPSSEFLLGNSLQAFDQDGNLVYEDKAEQLDGIFEDFLIFIEIIQQLPHSKEAMVKAAKNFNWENI
ncbi:NAD(P)H-dependent FMN reductase [Atopostipes suicloacalis DSM 15692]|uniref:NAD(P)H-dependent FMN reductase n=1 Tax=Atopostipes suicloacalis DSM 15692 TaxID=1121025 RepID=A0A1M4YFX9_9LACT|nr:NAD(P)H-dependent FMN reductase [Atopostipes suicloacalis DSM 15692]